MTMSSNVGNASRSQHLVPGTLVLLLALVVTWLSFTGEPASSFLFPRLIASVMLALAVWNFMRCVLGLARVGSGIPVSSLLTILPGLLVTMLLVFIAAKMLGFYVASFVAFLLLYALYDPASHLSLRAWLKRVLVAVLFMAVIYGLFSLLLRVQTPRGMFF